MGVRVGQPEGAIALFQASTDGPDQWPWIWRELAAFVGGAIRTYCWVRWSELGVRGERSPGF